MVNYYPYPCSVLQFPSDSIKLLTILTRLHLSSSPWVDLTICWICITLSELNIHNKHLLFQINTIVLWLTAYEGGGEKCDKIKEKLPNVVKTFMFGFNTTNCTRKCAYKVNDMRCFNIPCNAWFVVGFFRWKSIKIRFISFIHSEWKLLHRHTFIGSTWANNNFNAHRNESDKWDVCVRVSCSIRSSWFAPIYYYVIAGIFTTQQCFEICSILSVALTIQCVGIV